MAAGRQGAGLRWPRIWRGCGWTMVAVVVWLSLSASPPAAPEWLAWDKAQHLLAYAVLMLWFAQTYPRHWRWPLFLALLGAGLEGLQGLGDARHADAGDALANVLGVGLGLMLAAATPLGRLVAGFERMLRGRLRRAG